MNGQLIRVSTAVIAFLPVLLTLPTEARAFRLLWAQEATIADIEAAIRSDKSFVAASLSISGHFSGLSNALSVVFVSHWLTC